LIFVTSKFFNVNDFCLVSYVGDFWCIQLYLEKLVYKFVYISNDFSFLKRTNDTILCNTKWSV